ncbi:MAG TPA: hypothetical protein VK941_06730 [Gillisia sp.]|nr:hypothetical protein [Gillisia sp.]
MAKKSTTGKNSGSNANKASEEKKASKNQSAKKDDEKVSNENASKETTSDSRKTEKATAEKKFASKTNVSKSSAERKDSGTKEEGKSPSGILEYISFNARPGKILILRLFVKNSQFIPMLVRLSVDDWVSGDGMIYTTHNRIEPGYLYILQEGEAAATVSLLVPENIEEGQTLRSNLRFPGANELPLPIKVTALSPAGGDNQPEEKSFNISLPFGKVKEENEETRNEERISVAVYQLVSGLSNLSGLPSQWLFAEGLVLICMEGERLSKEKEGISLFSRISRTRLFKNLTLALTTARFPQWISGSIVSSSSLHAAMGGQSGQGRIVYIWLKWLFGIADTDIEDNDLKANFPDLPKANLEEAVARYGSEAQLWAGYMLLGLSSISPKLKSLIEKIAQNVPREDGKQNKNPKSIDDILNENGPLTR